ncbi:MAG: ROK family protein [Anaerolineae bacterium]
MSIHAAYDFDWYNVPLGPMLAERLGVPVVLANRGKMGALGEFEQGEGRGKQNVIYIWLGTGVTGGLILSGELYWGTVGAGEAIGHIMVEPNGEICGCGSAGCLMTVASLPAISKRARRAIKLGQASSLIERVNGDLSRIDGWMVVEAAAAGDPLALATVCEAGYHIGMVVAGMVNLLSPDIIIIGGPMSRMGEPLIGAIRQTVRNHSLSQLYSRLEIVQSKLGSLAGAVGAAYYVLCHTYLLAAYVQQFER